MVWNEAREPQVLSQGKGLRLGTQAKARQRAAVSSPALGQVQRIAFKMFMDCRLGERMSENKKSVEDVPCLFGYAFSPCIGSCVLAYVFLRLLIHYSCAIMIVTASEVSMTGKQVSTLESTKHISICSYSMVE